MSVSSEVFQFCPACHLKVAPNDPERVTFGNHQAHAHCVRNKGLLERTAARLAERVTRFARVPAMGTVTGLKRRLSRGVLADHLNTVLNTAYEVARIRRDELVAAAERLNDGVRGNVLVDVDGVMKEIVAFAQTCSEILRRPVVIAGANALPGGAAKDAKLSPRGKRLAALKVKVKAKRTRDRNLDRKPTAKTGEPVKKTNGVHTA